MAEGRVGNVDRPWDGLTGEDRQAAYLQATRAGDRSAWDALITDMTPLVWHVARGNGLDPHAAEEVVQTVWLTLINHLDQIKEPKALAGWLITTTRREALRAHRRTRPMLLSDELAETRPSSRPSPEAEFMRDERDRRIWRAFQQLPQRCQELLRLTILAGRAEYQVVADVMRMPRGSVGPTRGRCLITLLQLLAEPGGPVPGSEEELFTHLDGLLDTVGGVPDDLAVRMGTAVAAEGPMTRIGVGRAGDVLAASAPVSRDSGQDATLALAQSYFVYVAGDDHQAAKGLADAIAEVLAAQGIEAVPAGPPVISSWSQRFTMRVKRRMSSAEVKQRLQKVEHALEVVAVQKPMSEVNAQQADAVHKLLSSAEKCDSFVALVGSMLMVKCTDESGRVSAYAQTLSVAQVRALESNQHLLKSPDMLLAHLETLSHEDETSAAPAVHEVNGVIRPSKQLDRRA